MTKPPNTPQSALPLLALLELSQSTSISTDSGVSSCPAARVRGAGLTMWALHTAQKPLRLDGFNCGEGPTSPGAALVINRRDGAIVAPVPGRRQLDIKVSVMWHHRMSVPRVQDGTCPPLAAQDAAGGAAGVAQTQPRSRHRARSLRIPRRDHKDCVGDGRSGTSRHALRVPVHAGDALLVQLKDRLPLRSLRWARILLAVLAHPRFERRCLQARLRNTSEAMLANNNHLLRRHGENKSTKGPASSYRLNISHVAAVRANQRERECAEDEQHGWNKNARRPFLATHEGCA